MFWSLVPLVLGCILLAGLVGMCSFRPAGPGDGKIPSYDAAAALRADAATLGFPIRLPQTPDGWQANSTVGYIARTKMFVSLTQSNADEDKLVMSIHPEMYPSGTQDVNGVKWIVYDGGEGTEPVWTTRLDSPAGPAQLAITGAGSGDDFRTLAIATQTQPPIVPGR